MKTKKTKTTVNTICNFIFNEGEKIADRTAQNEVCSVYENLMKRLLSEKSIYDYAIASFNGGVDVVFKLKEKDEFVYVPVLIP